MDSILPARGGPFLPERGRNFPRSRPARQKRLRARVKHLADRNTKTAGSCDPAGQGCISSDAAGSPPRDQENRFRTEPASGLSLVKFTFSAMKLVKFCEASKASEKIVRTWE